MKAWSAPLRGQLRPVNLRIKLAFTREESLSFVNRVIKES